MVLASMVHNLFLVFGIGAAVFAVVISIIGLRAKDFPSRNAKIGLILVGVFGRVRS